MKLIPTNAFIFWASIVSWVDSSAAKHRQTNWEYGGISSPQRWGDLDPVFATCKSGRYQSPIDITRASAKLIKNKPLQLRWTKETLTNVSMINNGHTLQIGIPTESRVELMRDGVKYIMQQFHIHTPSEHHINGRYFDAEIHMVMSDKKNRKYQVLGVLMSLSDMPSKFLKDMCDGKIPNTRGESILVQHIDLKILFAEAGGFDKYFAYEGSLTTPPCTEGVRWIIARKPAHLTWRQLESLRRVIRYNARYVQINQHSIAH